MHAAYVVLPDFCLILLGLGIRRRLALTAEALAGVDRLVYYILFPALLFQAIVHSPITHASANLVYAALGVVCAGIVLGALARIGFQSVCPSTFASGLQCAYRFNSYIGFALIDQVAGHEGLAILALMVGFSVPLCNMVAVWSLARQGGGSLWIELAKNPLLMTTVIAVLLNFMAWQPPTLLNTALDHLGAGAIALGLLTVGASLQWPCLKQWAGLVAYWSVVKLLVLPLVALMLAHLLGLEALQTLALVIFAGLPAASNAYVLTMRMGGNGQLVALMVSVTTGLSALTLPFWINWVQHS